MIKARQIISLALALLVIASLFSMSGCAAGDWNGTWNRTGDATFSRAILEISDAGGSGFTFSLTLYNGNIAGELKNMTAVYTDSSKDGARCDIDGSFAYIELTLNEDGTMEVYFGNDLPGENSVGVIESDLWGFVAPAFISGHFERGKVEYINSSLASAGILDEQADSAVRRLMTDNQYERLLDCFQICNVGSEKGSGEHDDEIGGFVYYGSNTMQKYAAIMIIYDDGTVSVVVSSLDGSLKYFSDNSIYKDGSITPLPVTKWMKNYDAERDLAAAQP